MIDFLLIIDRNNDYNNGNQYQTANRHSTTILFIIPLEHCSSPRDFFRRQSYCDQPVQLHKTHVANITAHNRILPMTFAAHILSRNCHAYQILTLWNTHILMTEVALLLLTLPTPKDRGFSVR